MKPIVLEARSLSKTYLGKIQVPVLYDIDMVVREGEFIAIMGQSGSGKSTLLNILGCLDRPTNGELWIHHQEVSKLDEQMLATLRSEHIGFVFQYHFLLDEFTCLENALMPVLIRKGVVTKDERERVLRLLDRVGLTGQLDQTPDTMSGGECQRCALVRALVNEPRVILADEPTGNLDSRSGQDVFRLLREICELTGVAVIMVTHDDRLARAADRILLIEDGKMRDIPRYEHEDRAKRVSTVALT